LAIGAKWLHILFSDRKKQGSEAIKAAGHLAAALHPLQAFTALRVLSEALNRPDRRGSGL
jgi:hypothetical protein